MWRVSTWFPFVEFFCSTIDSERRASIVLRTALEVVGYMREFCSIIKESDFMADEIATGGWHRAAGCFLTYDCSWTNDRIAKLFIERVLQLVSSERLLMSVDCDISGQCTIDDMGRLPSTSLTGDA